MNHQIKRKKLNYIVDSDQEEETQLPPVESDQEEETQLPPVDSDQEEETQLQIKLNHQIKRKKPNSTNVDSDQEEETQATVTDPDATQLYEVTNASDDKISFFYKGENYYLDIDNNVYEKDNYDSYTLIGKLNDTNYQIDFI